MKNVKVKALVWWTLIFFCLVLTEETSKIELKRFASACEFSSSRDFQTEKTKKFPSLGVEFLISYRSSGRTTKSTQLSLTLQKSTIKLRRCSESEEGKKIWKSWPTTPRTSSLPPSRTSLLSNLLRKWLTWMSWTLLRFTEWNFMQKWTKSRGNFVEATNRMNEKGKKKCFFLH